MYYDFDGNVIPYKQTPPFKVLKGIYVDAARIKILKDDLERYLLIWGIPIFDTKNEVISGVFISIDVTEIKEKIFSNELQERLFDIIKDYINQPIFFIDTEGNPIGCNEAGKEINSIYFDKDDRAHLKNRFQKAPIYDKNEDFIFAIVNCHEISSILKSELETRAT